MESGLAVAAILVTFVLVRRFFFSTKAKEVIALVETSQSESIKFQISKIWYWVAAGGLVLGIAPFGIFFFVPRIEALAVVGVSCLSLLFLAPSVGLVHQVRNAQLTLTPTELLYRRGRQHLTVNYKDIERIAVVGFELVIFHGQARGFRIPLIFKGSSALVQIVTKRHRETRSTQ
jgi:hypothetical protein